MSQEKTKSTTPSVLPGVVTSPETATIMAIVGKYFGALVDENTKLRQENAQLRDKHAALIDELAK